MSDTPAYTIEMALSEAQAELAAAPTTAAEPAPAEPAEPTAATEPAPAAEAKPAPTEDLDQPLSPQAKAARAEAKLRKERERLEADRKQHAEELAFAKRVKEAKSAGKRLQLLREAGFTDDDIADFYQTELTEHFVSRQPETPESKLEKLLDEKLSAKDKADEDARQAAQTQLATEMQNKYWNATQDTLERDADKYPNVIRALATGRKLANGERMSREAIFVEVEDFHARTGRGATPTEILEAFERHLSPVKTTAAPQQTTAGRTITGEMRNGASTTGAKQKSQDEEFEDELRRAGLL